MAFLMEKLFSELNHGEVSSPRGSAGGSVLICMYMYMGMYMHMGAL